MIPEQFHAIWQKELTLQRLLFKTMWFWWRCIYSRLMERARLSLKDYKLEVDTSSKSKIFF
jgi:hypothetical protein